MPKKTPDPVSVVFEPGAERLLARALAARGGWVGTRVADPTPRQVEAAARVVGTPVTARDPVRGGLARTRWVRGFVRAVYRAGKGGPSLEFEVGRHKPPLGVLPAGYAFRLRTRVNGRAHAGKISMSRRIYNPDGSPGARWADPAERDW